MSITKTLGGDRLGAGKKMKVTMHGYERSTHDIGYIWRSTMSAGTLVPFLAIPALPGDTFDINLDMDGKTHPTIGPLFGSYKVQLDVFTCPVRLYQAQLHNNKLGIGLHMADIKLPQLTLDLLPDGQSNIDDPDNDQINPSCILSYLGIRGIGKADSSETDTISRDFNALKLLAYWDIYKNYYANKQEEVGYVIHTPEYTIFGVPIIVTIHGNDLPQAPATGFETITTPNQTVTIQHTDTPLNFDTIIFTTNKGNWMASSVAVNIITTGVAPDYTTTFIWQLAVTGAVEIYSWDNLNVNNIPTTAPTPFRFNLSDIDTMRENILANVGATLPFNLKDQIGIQPYTSLLNYTRYPSYKFSQEGLGLKTYQSDLFNNWLQTEWIDGVGGINDITAIDTSGGSFNIDTLQLSKKVYDMLNRIAVSGGSYNDWLDAVYDHPAHWRAETPVYQGGLIRELVFQEVVSNAQSASDGDNQPLGTLAGKGIMSGKRKGGNITIKIDEPSYILGIVSLTPRIDYSQGNKWDSHLLTMDDFHKPALDEIGFQELITEQMAWWSTFQTLGTGVWTQRSAGKQPAWINYMTAVNETHGNFAIRDNEMFMTLNRRYEPGTGGIKDLTTYIDPTKFNHIFAQTSIDAQNFWIQLAVDITARRKMSAKLMPNL